MLRLLVLVAIVVLIAVIVVRLVKGFLAPRAGGDDAAAEAPEAKLVRCVRCGSFVPRADALPGPDGFRCSDPKCRAAP
jgi:hypothetical protein